MPPAFEIQRFMYNKAEWVMSKKTTTTVHMKYLNNSVVVLPLYFSILELK